MPIAPYRHRLAMRAAAVGLLAAIVAGCGTSVSTILATVGPETTPMRVGLGYIPSVQFAPFYLAQQAGYYADAGLEVTFENGNDADIIRLTGSGDYDIGIADGTSLIPAVSQGIPVRYLATLYADFPSIVFAKPGAGITTAADLEGKKLGMPGKFGSSWVMLQALLSSVGLTPADLEIVEFPDFGQRVAVEEGIVDAATGFINNEPIQLARSGTAPIVLAVDEVVPLPGPGLISGQSTIDGPKREAVRAFVAATLRAMADIAADPMRGVEAAEVAVPELAADREGQLAVLEATVGAWQSPYTEANGLGAIDSGAWTESIDFMRAMPESPVAEPVTADQIIEQELLP
ncbi:MAG TPA: ABC transporter substrate-binding protein [Candidatus Limnocylindrales bacterium]